MDLPEPLVPPEVDLTGYGWMPFHGHRLFGSEFNAIASDAEWRAGVTLWWAAWNQVPAASLPDDDVALARLADLGRDVRGWRKLRKNALHGFVKCSDGRLYHRALSRLALEAWDRRVRERDRKAKWRKGRGRSGDGDKDVPETGTGSGTSRGQERPSDSSVPHDRKRQDRTGQESPLTPQPANGHAYRTFGKGYDEISAPILVDAFYRAREALWGLDPPQPFPATDLSIADALCADGVRFGPVADFLDRRMKAIHAAGKPPPSSLKYFNQAIREALQAEWPGFTGG